MVIRPLSSNLSASRREQYPVSDKNLLIRVRFSSILFF
jgi:hypothetical protein